MGLAKGITGRRSARPRRPWGRARQAMKAAILPEGTDAEVQLTVVGAEDQFGVAFQAGGEDRGVRFSGLEAEGEDEGVAEPEECCGPFGVGRATGCRLTRGEGGGDPAAVKEVAGLVEGPERGGAGEGVGADGRGGCVERVFCRRRGETRFRCGGRGRLPPAPIPSPRTGREALFIGFGRGD